MMYAYATSTGLESVKLLADEFWLREWWVPDLICDDILDQLPLPIDRLNFYHIKDDLTIDWITVDPVGECVFYTIDFFGEEQNIPLENTTEGVITIRDNVFAAFPHRPLRRNEIWFNSLRKLVRGVTGSLILSSVELGGV